ncbi:hypothetical protein [Ruficoccus sp. ZRK36]|uniref:hypothetical protein n=1 Tax=Ruficoccus sp. ZRK36 TaxID=2866311 RepID=UPI001C739B1D|nr:hypothetical protein [Ruficoccus sp. ZRK36]QYY37051.1 hypothetical protein K0V07_06115 [Ruficoccus sp. ZRK36]
MKTGSREHSDLRKLFHDINGEIFLIRGNADMALIGLPEDSPARKSLKEIITHAEILSKHIETIHGSCLQETDIPKEKAL